MACNTGQIAPLRIPTPLNPMVTRPAGPPPPDPHHHVRLQQHHAERPAVRRQGADLGLAVRDGDAGAGGVHCAHSESESLHSDPKKGWRAESTPEICPSEALRCGVSHSSCSLPGPPQMKYYTHRQLCDCIAHGEASESEVAQVRSPRPASRRSIRCRPASGRVCNDLLYPKVTPRKQWRHSEEADIPPSAGAIRACSVERPRASLAGKDP